MNITKIPIVKALTESNHIEGEYTLIALVNAIKAYGEIDMSAFDIRCAHLVLLPGDPMAGSFRSCAVCIGGQHKPNYGKEKLHEMIDDWAIKWRDVKKQEGIRQAHIEFEDIHPFHDGNGRIGRMLMYKQQLDAGLKLQYIKEKDKYEYYKWFSWKGEMG